MALQPSARTWQEAQAEAERVDTAKTAPAVELCDGGWLSHQSEVRLRFAHTDLQGLRERCRHQMRTDGHSPFLGLLVLTKQHPKSCQKARIGHNAAQPSDEEANMRGIGDVGSWFG